MIQKQIDNKKYFQIYLIMNLVISITGISILIFYIRGAIIHDMSFIKQFIIPVLLFFVFVSVFRRFEKILKPSYIETKISEREIIIRTFQPNFRNGLRFIFMLRYTRYLNELKLSQQEYNDYKLLIDKFGFRKKLILQKIQKDGIYESSEINISLLGQKKYSNLILAIDRLKGKINLN
jgi:hypothetical protein